MTVSDYIYDVVSDCIYRHGVLNIRIIIFPLLSCEHKRPNRQFINHLFTSLWDLLPLWSHYDGSQPWSPYTGWLSSLMPLRSSSQDREDRERCITIHSELSQESRASSYCRGLEKVEKGG